MQTVTKRQAAQIFGGRMIDLAEAVGITKQGISRWPDVLTQPYLDRVVGAAVRHGKPIDGLIPKPSENIG